MTKSRGFTLLEVLVAIAILGLGLTVILSSQVGLFSGASRGQHLSMATNLIRCKMSEVEMELLRDGYQLTDQSSEGDCCEEDTAGAGEGYSCSWKIERIELPNPPSESLGDGGGLESDGLSKLAELAEQKPGESPGLEGLVDSLGGGASAAAGMAPMVMGFVYPQLKPMLEASIRKVTVTVTWKEGRNARDLKVVQYVTDPRQGEIDPDAPQLDIDGGLGGLFGSGGPGSALGGGTSTPGGGTGTPGGGGFTTPGGRQRPRIPVPGVR